MYKRRYKFHSWFPKQRIPPKQVLMPPKSKSKYKGKATQTKFESPKSQKSQNLTKLFASTISSAKQIKS
jgi:hypothetical protein